MDDKILQETKPKMEKVIIALENEFRTLHTGKASAALVEDVVVEYYGSKVPLKQMAQITTPQANQILIIPWDKAALNDVETGIRNSDLNLNPIRESGQVRLNLPPLSEERRRELTKAIHNKAEQARIAVRNIRHTIWEDIQKQVKKGSATEDDKYRVQEDLNKLVDDYNEEIEKLAKAKETEIMQV